MFFELFPQIRDMGIHCPHQCVTFRQAGVKDVSAREYLVRMADHMCENPKLTECKREDLTRLVLRNDDRVATEIHLDRAKPDLFVGLLTGRASQHRLYPRDNFLRIKRLYYVIICTKMKAA